MLLLYKLFLDNLSAFKDYLVFFHLLDSDNFQNIDLLITVKLKVILDFYSKFCKEKDLYIKLKDPEITFFCKYLL